MNIWAIGLYQPLKSFVSIYTRNCHAAIFMFSPDDLSSFEELKGSKETYFDALNPQPKLYVVITKTDILKNKWKVDISDA